MAEVSIRTDIRAVKKELRAGMKELRRSMTPEIKREKDRAILSKLVSLPEYREAELVLTYVSTAIEVDTLSLIRQALSEGKRVAVPYCIPGKIDMAFYEILSEKELAPGAFGVLEPDPGRRPPLGNFSPETICVLPGLSFDLAGYRLGYGKGYYDRFLSRFPGKNIGVCYNACVRELLPHGRYDRNASVLVTEKFVKRVAAAGQGMPAERNSRTFRREGEIHGRR